MLKSGGNVPDIVIVYIMMMYYRMLSIYTSLVIVNIELSHTFTVSMLHAVFINVPYYGMLLAVFVPIHYYSILLFLFLLIL